MGTLTYLLRHFLEYARTLLICLFWLPAFSQQTDAELLIPRGIHFVESGDYSRAAEMFDKAVKMDPTYALAWTLKGLALGHLGKYDGALVSVCLLYTSGFGFQQEM